MFKFITVNEKTYLAFQDEDCKLYIVEAKSIESETYYASEFDNAVSDAFYNKDEQ